MVLAHINDIFSLAATPTSIISASGSSSLHVHATNQPSFPLTQSLSNVHKLGCHHVAVSRNGKIAVSAGFGGEVKIWKQQQVAAEDSGPSGGGNWEAFGELDTSRGGKKSAGEVWAIALSEEGQFLAATTYDGRINVWDLFASERGSKVQEYETGSASTGSLGSCVDLSLDGKYTASGHQNGAVYVFNNESGRLQYSLPGMYSIKSRLKFREDPGASRDGAAC